MDREEMEEIPWSNLVAQVEDGVDRRWYIAAAVVAAAVLLVVGYNVLTPSGQPVAAIDSAAPVTVAPAPTTTTAPTAVTPVVVSEADLRIENPPSVDSLISLRAEWFVMDYFTLDGSPETVASIRGGLGSSLRNIELPHEADPLAMATFVEWARVVDVTVQDDGSYSVKVVMRVIAQSETGFDRAPVRAVAMRMAAENGSFVVVELPVPTDMPLELIASS